MNAEAEKPRPSGRGAVTKLCPRCGAPVKGTGKTGMCRPCAVVLGAKKSTKWLAARRVGNHNGGCKQRASRRPVSLAAKA